MNRARLGSILAILAGLSVQGCGGGQGVSIAPVLVEPEPTLSSAITTLAPGIAIGQKHWPDGSTTAASALAAASGIRCLVNEDYHIHAHVSVIADGQALAVPAQIGLGQCAYELHTHDASGVIHVETATARKFTLGQFFATWGQPLSRSNVGGISGTVRVYVASADGKLTRFDSADPGQIELTQHLAVYLVIGAGPNELPTFGWSGGL